MTKQETLYPYKILNYQLLCSSINIQQQKSSSVQYCMRPLNNQKFRTIKGDTLCIGKSELQFIPRATSKLFVLPGAKYTIMSCCLSS